MKNKKTALITGITGQDGAYLAEFLLGKNYKVFGLRHGKRIENIEGLKNKITIIQGDLLDEKSVENIVAKIKPDEIYNLAAQSSVSDSWNFPVKTGEVTALGAARLLEATRKYSHESRFYQASSSEMFGATKVSPQNENTKFYPRSPYGVAKLYAHWMTVNYRESYGMFAVSGILFNHESPRRGMEFVTRKISSTVARIKLGLEDKLYLGDISAKRDRGFAGDYVEAMWLMLQRDKPKDYVIGTGQSRSVKDFVEEAFNCVNLDWKKYVEIDKKFLRPADFQNLRADSSRAKKELGWKPRTDFHSLVKMMVDADLGHYSNSRK